MITADDLEYHHTEDSDFRWTETYYLPISVPEERIFGHVYCAVLPVLGAMQNDIRFSGAVCDTKFELLYIDSQNHLPAPERFSRLEGPNGLTVTAVRPPRDYRIDYVGYDDTEIHLDYIGIMDPFDINDPAQNPLASADAAQQLSRTSMGSGYKGHDDMHCRVTGTIKIRGREYAVDIVDRMNHSWGPRPEMEIPPMNSGWAQFGEELRLRFHLHLDPEAPAGEDQSFAPRLSPGARRGHGAHRHADVDHPPGHRAHEHRPWSPPTSRTANGRCTASRSPARPGGPTRRASAGSASSAGRWATGSATGPFRRTGRSAWRAGCAAGASPIPSPHCRRDVLSGPAGGVRPR